jgi:hypothetical protein
VATDAVPTKTPAGLAELNTRRRRLSQRHRTLLHLADGRRSENQLRQMSAQAGVPDSCFGELLAMGLIELRGATGVPATPAPHAASHDTTLDTADAPAPRVEDSGLTAVRSTPAFGDSDSGQPLPASSWFLTDPIDGRSGDDALERARDILLRTLRAEAPLAGSLTSLRLQRARSRAELHELIGEVEARVGKPPRSLTAALALQRVRSLLAGPRQLAWAER